jgi:low affinity Fe/Cu permease
MALRLFSSISVETTLASSINSTVTSMTVATGTATTLLGGVTLVPNSQFTVAIDPDTINEEIVFITAGPSGDTFTISRGQAGTGTAGVSGLAHSTGASVKHVLTSDDLNAFEAGAENSAGGTISSLLLMGG